MKRKVIEQRVNTALEFYEKAGIVLTEEEKKNIEVADFGLARGDGSLVLVKVI